VISIMTNPKDQNHPQGPPEDGYGAGDDTQAAALVTASGPGELVPLIPYLLAYQPSPGEGVVVAMSGIYPAMVLPFTVAADQLGRVWPRLAQPLADCDATDVIIIGYGDVTAAPLLSRLAAASPLPVSDLLRVDGDRWWPLQISHHPSDDSGDNSGDNTGNAADITGYQLHGSAGAGSAGAGGLPLVRGSAAEVRLLALSGSPAASREDLLAGLRPGSHIDAPAVAALLPVDPEPAASVLWQAVSVAHDDRRDGPVPIDPSQASLLLHAVSKVAIRDACALWRDDAAWWLWQDLIRLAPPGWISVPATLLGLSAYLRGNGVVADPALQHALADDPTNRLAAILRWALTLYVSPEELDALLDEVARHHPAGPSGGCGRGGRRREGGEHRG
jgi:hypothetical protein